jgi:hypothetical protein
LVSSTEIVSLPAPPNTSISPVLATVAGPPLMDTAPSFTKICPAASRLVVIVLAWLSPVVVNTPVVGLKLLVIAIVLILSKVVVASRDFEDAENGGSALQKYFRDR